MAVVREAHVVWNGDLASGNGMVDAVSSKAFTALPVSFASRTESPSGRTSPEELIAAAHASCFAMALSGRLGRAGTPPQRLEVSAKVTFDRVGAGWKVVSSALSVKGVVRGVTQAKVREEAEAAKEGCPVSQALKGNVALSVEASLER